MSDIVIAVESLGKKYAIEHQQTRSNYKTLRETMTQAARRMTSGWARRTGSEKPAKREEFWALRDVSFELKRGQVLGIIGRNGAGKSTLLKVLSRITAPTEGRVTLRGRVASLLEVGTGFHPELTGRENIFLNGSILGMSRAEIKGKFEEIVDFAGIEKFLDTPVKRYSSGMYVRLAFAVAAHLEPEILIVDEVLAVGDSEFQKKCLGKMQDVANTEGRTVLFVSHNMQAVSALTTRCLVLQDGMCKFDGETSTATAVYLKAFGAQQSGVFIGEESQTAPRITRVRMVTSEPDNAHICGKPMRIIFKIATPITIRGACLSFQFLDSQFRPVVHLWTFDSERPMCREPGIFEVVCEIQKLRLYMGSYSMNVYFSEPPGGQVFQRLEHICPFEVHMFGHYREFEWRPDACAYLEEASWSIFSQAVCNV
jgi:lipopolysaccharide transport system ATP-binding protein